jgi:hypothetical protein
MSLAVRVDSLMETSLPRVYPFRPERMTGVVSLPAIEPLPTAKQVVAVSQLTASQLA